MSTAKGDAPRSSAKQAKNPDRNGRFPDDAERMAEEWAGRVTAWIARSAARAREEAEDIWAEAQSIRHGR